jgi:hypothetical protein
MEAFKIKTFTRSQSIAVQSALFAQGIRWINYKDDKVDCELRCFFVNEKGELMHDGRNYEDFEKHPYKEIAMQEIAPSIAIDEKKFNFAEKKTKTKTKKRRKS